MLRRGFFTYPWDLLDEGAADAVRFMAERAHCNAIALNAIYHHARLLRPRARGAKTLQLTGALAAFEPQVAHYPDELMPMPDMTLARANVLAQARDACRAHGLDFGLWVVALHNSTLGTRHPELCMQNCFGDVYTYALCPAQPQVQAYVCALVDDLCAQFKPQRIILEAVGYLSLRHWVHHELVMVEWDETLELLTALCFCSACLRACAEAGLDARVLQDRVRELAERLLNEERGALPLDFRHGETAALLAEISGLVDFLQRRSQNVTRLVAEVAEIAHAHSTVLEVIPASFHRPSSRAWTEGASLADLGNAADGLLIPAYFSDPAQVAADLSWAAARARPISAGLNACEPNANSATQLSALAAAAQAAGAQGLYYYNYGMLTARRLEWIAQANVSLLARGKADAAI
jgi:hypothetical protein